MLNAAATATTFLEAIYLFNSVVYINITSTVDGTTNESRSLT